MKDYPVILFFIGIFVFFFIYYEVKKRLKQNVFQKEQYEEQKRLTEKPVIYVVNADIATVMNAVKKAIPVDTSVKAVFKGGNYSVESESDNVIVYHHASKITTGGEGDEFTAQIVLEPYGDNQTQVSVSIIRWRENDGVTRKAGIAAMQEFHTMVKNAVAEINHIQKQ